MSQGKVDPDAAARILRDYLSSSKGQSKLAATMALPLRQRMDYQSLGRKTFLMEDMNEPCGTCRRTDYDEGHAAGCQECSVRSVLTT